MCNGPHSVDWSQLQLAADFYGIPDLEALTEALLVIKHHVPPEQRRDDDETEQDT